MQAINDNQAVAYLEGLEDKRARIAIVAIHVAWHVIDLSSCASADQDLSYFVELFLSCISDKSVIGNIVSGAISRHSRQLSDPDFW